MTLPTDSPARRRRRWPLVALVVVLTVVLVRCALPGATIDDHEGIVGTYVVNGVDPNGVEYSGTVTITDTDAADRYVVQWLVTGAIQEGTGVLTGDRFEVTWRTTSSGTGEASGTASYTIDAEGVLRGTRTIDGIAGSGTEDIFPET
ncbi:MAG: hypothetical protein KDB40_14585 [Acidimicrobiales bacterium]|nr:hypothetical protein [Acidimicrobiales bacterium]MCB9394834.1 hypothetical protein [Acidimicrobiaceae bacterium]